MFPNENDFVIGGSGSQYTPPSPVYTEEEILERERQSEEYEHRYDMSYTKYSSLYRKIYGRQPDEDVYKSTREQRKELIRLLWVREMNKCQDMEYWFKNYYK